MFSQNLVSGRDLFSSNPCRDFWDSQQFSQAASGSQSSQQSSVELFSQSKSSQSQQQRISTSCDWWSNTGNSQQINEDEPVKYYMKYLSKPPIFSDESKKDQEKSKSENLKKFIETQKTKTLELDQRDLLDTFIGLLKDYTKEVQTAMKTFETSLGNSLSTNNMNFEKMSSVAEKSFCVVDELKTDFDNRFDKLRKELKENEELRSIILKNEQNMAKMDMDIQLQKKQIEDFKRREDDALRREEKYKQREDQLLIRIKEAERHHSFRDTPPPSQHQDLPVLQRNERSLLETGMQISKPGFSGKDMVPSKRDSEHLGYLCSRNTNENIQATNIAFPPSQSVLQKCYPGSSLAEDTGSTCHCFPSQANAVQFPLTQKVNETHVLSETNAIIYPLPTTTSMHIAPVQKSDSSTQCLPLVNSYSEEWQKQLSISFPITAVSPTIRPSIQLEKQVEQPTKTAPSPANRLLLLTKDKWPKHSPVATVLPQVQVRQQVPSHDRSSNQDKKQQEDPLGIFIFDLTASPILDHSETECHLDQETLMVKREQIDESPVKTKSSTPKKRQKKNAEKQLRKYGTRSRGKVEENENTSIEKGVSKIRSKKSCQTESSSSKTISGLKRKAHNTGVVTNNKKKCDIGIAASAKSHAKEFDLKTHDTQVLEEISRSSFKRQRSEKRTLNLAGSSLFESVNENVSLEQIKESIRKHVQKQKLIKQKCGT